MRVTGLVLFLSSCINLDKSVLDTGGGPDTNPGGDSGVFDSDDSDSDSGGQDSGDSGPDSGPSDRDGDGFSSDVDCDDDDGATYPGAEEICGDGGVNDCDSAATEEAELCRLPASFEVSESDAILVAESSGDDAGHVVAGAGDVNGDGLMDVLVGAPEAEYAAEDRGITYLILGGTSGTPNLVGAEARLIGEEDGADAGFAVDAGDVDGDGAPDFLIGAPRSDSAAPNAGAAYLAYGPAPKELELSGADATFYGVAESDYAGWAVATGADLSGDGLDDAVVGAYSAASGGALYLFTDSPSGNLTPSSADAIITGEAVGDEAGISITLGDLNADGEGDVLTGATGNSRGAAYVVLGPVISDVSLADADVLKLTGSTDDDEAGRSVAFTATGCADGGGGVLVGATDDNTTSGSTPAGSAYLVCGPDTDVYLAGATATITGLEIADQLGYSVADAGDVDGDGNGDILVGAPGTDAVGTDSGASYLFYGPVEGDRPIDTADVTFIAAHAGDRLGSAVAGPGDTNGDGLDDVLLGAENESTASGGAAYLILGGP